MRTTDLGFTKTKNHHRSGPRQHNTTTDLGCNNTAQHNTILQKVDDDLVLVHKDPKECERIQSLKKIQLKEWSMVVTKTLPPTMIAPSSHQSTMKISPFLNKMNNTHYHFHHLHLHRHLHLHHHHHQTHFRVILAIRFHCLRPTTSSAIVRFPGEVSR